MSLNVSSSQTLGSNVRGLLFISDGACLMFAYVQPNHSLSFICLDTGAFSQNRIQTRTLVYQSSGTWLNKNVKVPNFERKITDSTSSFSVFSAREMLKMHRTLAVYLYQINGQNVSSDYKGWEFTLQTRNNMLI